MTISKEPFSKIKRLKDLNGFSAYSVRDISPFAQAIRVCSKPFQLSLESARFKDQEFNDISEIASLINLVLKYNFANQKLTGSQLHRLCRLKNLSTISLPSVIYERAVIEDLGNLKTLRYPAIGVDSTWTKDHLDELKKAIPLCSIFVSRQDAGKEATSKIQ